MGHIKRAFYTFIFLSLLSCGGAVAAPVALRGEHEEPNQEFGEGADYLLEADATFGWKTKSIAGDVDINGYTLTMDTGGGNATRFSGALRGVGAVVWSGGPEVSAERMPSYLDGQDANTFSGTLELERGLLILNKPAGVDALAGSVRIGSSGWAELRWGAPDQLADAVDVTFESPGPGVLDLNGASETLGALAVRGDGQIKLGTQAASIRFADSHDIEWGEDAQLLIFRGGDSRPDSGVRFGDTAKGLSDDQLARVGFVDPGGQPAGLYRAKMDRHGLLAPAGRVEPVDPAYDMSGEAYERRQSIYDVDGLDALRAQLEKMTTPITVSLFGDSITWQDGYARVMREAMAGSTDAQSIKFINRGINGGGVGHLRDGANGLFDQDQGGFADVLRADQPQVAVVLIGVNDATWLETSPEDFRAGLVELVRTAKAKGVLLILATLTVQGELPDGRNPIDDKLDAYAAITLEVADQLDVASIDLRSVYLAYLKNRNVQLRLDGSVQHRSQGVLTYDRVHPTATGNRLLAEHIAAAIAGALAPVE